MNKLNKHSYWAAYDIAWKQTYLIARPKICGSAERAKRRSDENVVKSVCKSTKLIG
jgi:hypothetical protein